MKLHFCFILHGSVLKMQDTFSIETDSLESWTSTDERFSLSIFSSLHSIYRKVMVHQTHWKMTH